MVYSFKGCVGSMFFQRVNYYFSKHKVLEKQNFQIYFLRIFGNGFLFVNSGLGFSAGYYSAPNFFTSSNKSFSLYLISQLVQYFA